MSTAAPPVTARPDARAGPRERTSVRPPSRLVYVARAAAAASAVLLIAYLGISYKYADTLTRVERHAPVRSAANVAPTHEDVTFTASDGVNLKGWWFAAPSPRQRAVVIVHGKDQTRIDSSFDAGRIAHVLLERGYSALLFDLRGHGESEGLRWGLGKHEALDVAAAVDLAAAKANVPRSRVAIVAESMGAGSAMMALDRVPDVGPMVLDSVYTSAATVIDEIGPSVSGLPSWFTPGMELMAQTFFGLDVDAVQPVRVVRAHPERAFLFLRCDNDTTVSPHHGAEMKAASTNAATELVTFTGCGHVKALITYPSEWEGRVVTFLEGQLGK